LVLGVWSFYPVGFWSGCNAATLYGNDQTSRPRYQSFSCSRKMALNLQLST
jgi:hypothetical protein